MQLYITTPGAYLHVREALFEVRIKSGEEVRRSQFAPQKIQTIILHSGAALSTDAVQLALRHHVDIVFADGYGDPMGRIWHGRPGSTVRIRKAQLEASLGRRGLEAVQQWLGAKLDNQRAFIEGLLKHRPQHSDYLRDKIQRIGALALSIRSVEGACTADAADTLRGLEGTAGRLYFETLSYVLPREWQFEGRSMRPARDAFNAFLNYAYGVLYGRVEKALVVAGLDPYVGFLHRDDYNLLSFVFDFIEPYRIYAETAVFRLFTAKKVSKSHLDPLPGGCALNAEGKALLVEALNAWLDTDTFRYRGKNRSRFNALRYDAHAFAASLTEENRPFDLQIL